MQLATECIIVSLIYIEKIMTTCKIEIRFTNWRPLLFTSILIASKFWEDICYWNIDYEEALDFYPLKSINKMESEFLGLCGYDMYVSKEKYINYYKAVRRAVSSKNGKPRSPIYKNNESHHIDFKYDIDAKYNEIDYD